MKTKKNIYSNLSTVVLVAFVASLFLFPSFKGKVMQGLMSIGLFQPNVPEPSARPLPGTSVGTSTEQVSFENSELKEISLASLKGKVVFINFWATWCPPCIAEMPTIQTLYISLKDNDQVVFMLVDVDGEREKSQAFMDKRSFDLPVYTPASAIPENYLGGAIPTTLVLNKKGEIVFKHEGMGDFSNQEFNAFIHQLMAE